jgi:hypothetical protein
MDVVKSESSTLSGSWFSSFVIIILRKSFLSSVPFGLATWSVFEEELEDELVEEVPEVVLVVSSVVSVDAVDAEPADVPEPEYRLVK